MKTALIIHGMPGEAEFLDQNTPSPSNSHWLPWLQKQLLMQDYLAQAPEMPKPYQPNYPAWKETFEQFTLSSESILIGHSCGGGFLLRWLSENPVQVKRVVIVAPWLDVEGEDCPEFFDFKIRESLTSETDFHIVASDNDRYYIESSVEKIRTILPDAHFHLFPGYGHFLMREMNTIEFPELRDIALHGSAVNAAA
jgi:predicted alpha/beta hydrolase family esterase